MKKCQQKTTKLLKKKIQYAKLIIRRFMLTKEWDGGNMGKTVEKIVINTESIDIVSVENGVNSIVQLGLEAQEDSIKDIFEKYNLNIMLKWFKN